MYSFLLDNDEFNLSLDEMIKLEESTSLLRKGQNLYAMHALYDAFYINILRRIEFFGANEVLSRLNKDSYYDKQQENINKRWQEFNQIDLIKIVKDLKILRTIPINLFYAFYQYKKTTFTIDEIDPEYLVSFFYLLKVELFAQKFVKFDKSKFEFKRRRIDFEQNIGRRESDSQNVNKKIEFSEYLKNTSHV